MNDRTEIPSGFYRSFEGFDYFVMGIAKHAHSQQEMVVYRSMDGKKQLFVLPVEEFLKPVEVEGQEKPRFNKVK